MGDAPISSLVSRKQLVIDETYAYLTSDGTILNGCTPQSNIYYGILTKLCSHSVGGGVSASLLLLLFGESAVGWKNFDLTDVARLGIVGWLDGGVWLDDGLGAVYFGGAARR